jgi:hypothetical protein
MEPLALGESLSFRTKDGTEMPFDVVGIVEDPSDGSSYAVLRHEAADGEEDFVVTDLEGNLLRDEAAAQTILDEFLRYAEEAD